MLSPPAASSWREAVKFRAANDCAAGLLCDFSNRKQHTCQPAGPAHPDLSMPDLAAIPDAAIND